MLVCEKINQRKIQMEKTCEECGAVVKTLSWARHLLTKKHKKGKKVQEPDIKPFSCRTGKFIVHF
jgi:hypothetical protein